MQLIVEILGEKVYRIPENFYEFEKFKSPEDLAYKIIIKSKGEKEFDFSELNLGPRDPQVNNFLSDKEFEEKCKN